MLKWLMRFFGMYAPLQSIRVAMYRKAGVYIGKPLYFGTHIFIDLTLGKIVIEDNVGIAGYTHILSHSFIFQGYKTRTGAREGYHPVLIKDGARIGVNVTILAGVTIGENSVVGAGAVVASDIPPNCLAVGVPAKPIKYYKSQ
jgi:acetyltransferase-like isoleucine patch superfamily enzyme